MQPHIHLQNKAPPHVEGELLKQNTKAIVGKKGWKKYFFIVSPSFHTTYMLPSEDVPQCQRYIPIQLYNFHVSPKEYYFSVIKLPFGRFGGGG